MSAASILCTAKDRCARVDVDGVPSTCVSTRTMGETPMLRPEGSLFMTELIWLNGETLPMGDARLGIEDRGFQFADGVYEVIRIYNGKPFTLVPHLERLWRSAVDIQLTPPLTTDALANEITKFIAHTAVREGMVYLQLTRGVAP